MHKDAVYLVESLAYVAAALALTIAVLRPSLAAWLDTLMPADDDRRLVLLVLVLPLVLPAVLAPISHTVLTPLWTLPNWVLLPVVLLSSPLITVTRNQCSTAIGAACLLSIGALIVAPAVALRAQLSAPLHSEDYASTVASAIRKSWDEAVGGPVPIVLGESPLAASVAFYLKTRSENTDAKRAVQKFMAGQGGAYVCSFDSESCTLSAISMLGMGLDSPISREITG